MSTFTHVPMNANSQMGNYDTTKIFLRDNKFEVGSFTNADLYDDVTLQAGTLLGRVASTNKLVIFNASGSDGSQFPVGVLAEGKVVGEGETVNLTFCTGGEISKGKIILPSGVTFNTVVSGKTVNDRIKSDTAGIILVQADQLTGFDNQPA